MPESRPEVRWSLTEEDIFRFEWHHLLHIQRSLLAIGYVAILMVSFFFGYFASDDSPAAGASYCIFGALITPPLLRGMSRLKARHDFRTMPAAVRESGVEISPTGFHQSGPYGEGSFHWPAVYRIVGTRDQILLYLTGRMAMVIPRRAFPTPEAADAFLEAARRWHAAATATAVDRSNG